MEKTFRVQQSPNGLSVMSGKRILFANVPADGHFNPLTGLAVHLQSIGYDVRWYSSELYADRIKKLNIPYYPFRKALEVTPENLDEVFPERKTYKTTITKLRFDMINFFILRSTEYFADISEIRHSFPFDLMIADVAFSAVPLVKEKLGVPVITVGVFPLTETSKDLAPAGLGLMPSDSTWGRRRQAILRYLSDKVLFKKPNRVMNGILAEYGIANNHSNIFDTIVRKSTLVLQSGTPGFEYKRSDLGENIKFIGPLLPYDSKKKRVPWFHEKLNQYKKVILVTQGTVERDPEKIIVPTLEAFKYTDCLVVATTGGSKTQELRARYPDKNIIIEDFIPFADIMPYADVYITNGGYGGVMLAIENELPLIVAGIHEGKNEINARVGYFRLGINLSTETPRPAQIRSSAEEIFWSDEYNKNVKQLSEEFALYNPLELSAFYVQQVLDGTRQDREVVYEERLAVY